jgi:hypothetical protein
LRPVRRPAPHRHVELLTCAPLRPWTHQIIWSLTGILGISNRVTERTQPLPLSNISLACLGAIELGGRAVSSFMMGGMIGMVVGLNVGLFAYAILEMAKT